MRPPSTTTEALASPEAGRGVKPLAVRDLDDRFVDVRRQEP